MPFRLFSSVRCLVWAALYCGLAPASVAACGPDQHVCLEPLEPAAAPAIVPVAETVEHLADAITADLKARRLTRPRGNNALERIERMETLAPDHDYAINGRQYIVNIYAGIARWQLQRGNRASAFEHLQTMRSLKPGSAVVEELTSLLAGNVVATETPAKQPEPVRQVDPAPGASRPSRVAEITSAVLVEQTPVEPTEEWRPSEALFPQMVAIPAGHFEMGGRLPTELPRRRVQLQAFSLSRHEVTVAQYRKYALAAGIEMPAIASERDLLPVTGVNWDDAVAYTNWLASKTGRPYRLPTEAEWEYAARAGTSTPFFSGESLREANCVGCDTSDHAEPLPVGSYAANDFGLYDVHGNVWEWVQDCWRDNYREADTSASAYDREQCQRRVLRGGSWYNTAEFARSAYRGREVSEFRDGGVGFRVAHDGL